MTPKQLNKFNIFLLRFIRAISKRSVTAIYRGDNLKNIHEKLGVWYDERQDLNPELLKRLFMIGEKYRTYYSQDYFNFNRTAAIGINDSDESVFCYIFEAFNKCVKNNKVSAVQEFFKQNAEFSGYFREKRSNKKEFVKAALILSSEQRLLFRNYYFKLLHQIGTIIYKEKSHMLSTSTDYSIAKRFSGSRHSNDGVIIHAWQPNYGKHNLFQNTNLPKYKGKPYQNQYELSLLAGISPHFMIGLENLKNKKIHLNPNLFSAIINDEIFSNGFIINQDEFEIMIQKTNYDRYFVSDGYEYIEMLK